MYLNYQKLFNGTDIKDISLAIRLQRAVKSSYELDIMRKAAERSDLVAGGYRISCAKESQSSSWPV